MSPLTVAELVELLEQYPAGTLVRIELDDESWCEVSPHLTAVDQNDDGVLTVMLPAVVV